MNWRKVHLYCTWIWVVLLVPTVFWWKDSILFIGLASVYANVVSHWTAYQAARAEKAASNGQTNGVPPGS
jgi:hypothetical protein